MKHTTKLTATLTTSALLLIGLQTSQPSHTVMLGTSTIAKWPNSGFGKGTIRYAHPGQSTKELLQDTNKIKNKKVIIYTGDNDITKTSRGIVQQNIKLLIEQLQQNNNTIYLLTPKIAPKRLTWATQIQQLRWWEQNLPGNINVINTARCDDPQNFDPDGIHYNTNGYQCIETLIKQKQNTG